jgi:hypothetical protein
MFNGRQQPSRGGTSRMMREYQVRFCERLGVKFPGPTRHLQALPRRNSNGRFTSISRHPGRSLLITVNQPFGEWGQGVPGPSYDLGGDRPPRPSRHHHRDERRELPSPRCHRAQARLRPASHSHDNQSQRRLTLPIRCGPVSDKAPGLARKDRGCRECPNACLSLVPCDPWLRGLAGRMGSYRLICTYLFFDTAFYTYQKRLLLAGSSKSERKTLLRQCMKSRA